MKFKEFLKQKGISESDYNEKTAVELAELHNEFSQSKTKVLEEKIGNATTKEEVEVLIKENQKIADQAIKNLKTIIKTQGETVTALKFKGNIGNTVKTFEQAVEEALKEKFDDLQEFVESKAKGGQFEIEIKVPASIIAGNTTGGTTPINYAGSNVNTISEYPRHNSFIEDYLNTGSTDQPSIPYIDEMPGEGDVQAAAEGSLKPLIDADFEVEFSQAKKIAGRMKVSDESLSDFKWLKSQILGTLKRRHDIARQSQILNGAGTGANLKGIVPHAPAFNPAILGSLANSVPNPNYYDVLATLCSAIETESVGNFMPNLILMNTMDSLKMKLTKDIQGRYLLPPFIGKDGRTIDTVQILTKPFIKQGEFVVGDFKLANLIEVWGYKVLIGMENDDFSKNMRTMIGESRLHLYLTQNDRRAFVKGAFADVITALKKQNKVK